MLCSFCSSDLVFAFEFIQKCLKSNEELSPTIILKKEIEDAGNAAMPHVNTQTNSSTQTDPIILHDQFTNNLESNTNLSCIDMDCSDDEANTTPFKMHLKEVKALDIIKKIDENMNPGNMLL